LARPDDDRVRRGVAAQRVDGRAGRDPETAALARGKPPEACVAAELRPLLVDDRTVGRGESLALEERPVVAAREEARLLTLGSGGGRQPRARGLGPCLVLARVPERE